jgi:exonuclease SbcD
MRIIHTADWHLGKLFYGVYLTDDQAYVLDEFILLLREERPDLLIIAGDIYDRAVPPPPAVGLLDDILCSIVLELRIPVIMIAGNHDNPQRMGFGSRLFSRNNFHLVGTMSSPLLPVIMKDEHGEVFCYALSYMQPAEAREILVDETIHSHEQLMRVWISQTNGVHTRGKRSVLTTHAYTAGGEESESERPLSVGGIDAVPASVFARFSYTALGHLHKPQKSGYEHVRHAGSLLKYSFSEAGHTKSVCMVEIDGEGMCKVKEIPLSPRHDVRCMTGYFDDILRTPPHAGKKEDYLMISLLDSGVILDPMRRLKAVYPNLLHIERPALSPDNRETGLRIDHRKIDDMELFSSFYSQVTGSKLPDNEAEAFSDVIEKVIKQEREY